MKTEGSVAEHSASFKKSKSTPKVQEHSSNIWIPNSFGKIFRTDPDEKHLFINTFFNEIQIHFGVGTGNFSTKIIISNIPGKGVVDFLPLKNDLILVFTSDNMVLIYEYSEKVTTLVYKCCQDMGEYFGINCSGD
jgi:hypothetical protein